MRGAGSAAFVLGTLLSGQLIDRFGLSCIIVTSSVLFLVMAFWAARILAQQEDADPSDAAKNAYRDLWAISAYRQLIFVVALVIGSHALNDTVAVISWRAAGYGSAAISLLWSESVPAEVAMFFVLGPRLLKGGGGGGGGGLHVGRAALRGSRGRGRRPSLGRHGNDHLDARARRRSGSTRHHFCADASRSHPHHRAIRSGAVVCDGAGLLRRLCAGRRLRGAHPGVGLHIWVVRYSRLLGDGGALRVRDSLG